MTDWPAHVEPLDREILDLLCSVPATWIDPDHDRITSTQQEALRWMTLAGPGFWRFCRSALGAIPGFSPM